MTNDSYLSLVSFGSFNFTSPYHAWIDSAIPGAGNLLAPYSAQTVETVIPGMPPSYVRGQPLSKQLVFHVDITPYNQANVEAFFAAFDPALGQQALVVEDLSEVERSVQCQVESVVFQTPPAVWRVTLRATYPIWQAVTPSSETPTITTSGQTTSLDSDGDTLAPLTIAITPSVAKDAADSWPNLIWLNVANRSEQPLNDPAGDGYPILLCNLTDLSIAKIGGTWNHVRIFRYGAELDRYVVTIDDNGNVWSNLDYAPKKAATLAADIDDSVTSLQVSNPDGFTQDHWPAQGFFIWDDGSGECTQYSGASGFDAGTLTRGARGTTATSHTAGAALYWMETSHLYLLYGYTAAGAPPAAEDREPVINLATSDNNSWLWDDQFFNDQDRKSATWLRVQASFPDPNVRTYDGTGAAIWEDQVPVAGKPAINNIVRNFPVPIKGAADAVTLDMAIDPEMLIEAYVQDIDGNETRLFSRFWPGGTALTYSPSGVLTQMRLNVRVGAIAGNLNLGAASMVSSVNDTAAYTYTDSAGTTLVSGSTTRFPALTFKLDQVTLIEGLIMGFATSGVVSGGMTAQVFTDGGDRPGRNVAAFHFTIPDTSSVPTLIATDDLAGLAPTLEAGQYWILLEVPSAVLIALSARVSPDIYWAHMIDQTQVSYLKDLIWDYPGSSNNPFEYDTTQTPIFGVLSRTVPAQSDAPLQNGATAAATNLTATLDDARSPLIALGAPQDVYLLDAAPEIGAVGINTFYPIKPDETLTIHCDTHRVIDGETGLDVPWAVTAADNWLRWLSLLKGSNTLSWTEPGVVGLGLSISWSDHWL